MAFEDNGYLNAIVGELCFGMDFSGTPENRNGLQAVRDMPWDKGFYRFYGIPKYRSKETQGFGVALGCIDKQCLTRFNDTAIKRMGEQIA